MTTQQAIAARLAVCQGGCDAFIRLSDSAPHAKCRARGGVPDDQLPEGTNPNQCGRCWAHADNSSHGCPVGKWNGIDDAETATLTTADDMAWGVGDPGPAPNRPHDIQPWRKTIGEAAWWRHVTQQRRYRGLTKDGEHYWAGQTKPGRGPRGTFPATVDERSIRTLILTNTQGLGDQVALTAAIRDLHLAHPGKYTTCNGSPAVALRENCPTHTPAEKLVGPRRSVNVSAWNQSDDGGHFIGRFHQALGKQLGVEIPLTKLAGDIHLSADEMAWRPSWPEPYAVLWAGGKNDFTVKLWPTERYQAVVDHFSGRLVFVQVGNTSDIHRPLRGVVSYMDKPLREVVKIMYRASMGISPISFGMHLSAATPTSSGSIRPHVVIAGGRETPHTIRYPGHIFLDTIGRLDCCQAGGCWKFKAGQDCRHHTIETGTSFANCMMDISADEVIRHIETILK